MIGVWNLVLGRFVRRLKLPVYIVTFEDYDGTILKTEQVIKGNDATPPSDPTRTDYTFSGWSGDYADIQQDTVITATYTENTVYHYVRFYDWDGTLLDTDKVEEGYDATPPSEPTRSGYRFNGWNGNYTDVYQDEDVYATYWKVWDVTFYDTDGVTVLDIDTVDEGDNATPPSVTAPEGYRVVWNGNYKNVQQDEDVYLEYHKKVYTITYYDYNGDYFGYRDVEHGDPCPFPYDSGVDYGWKYCDGSAIPTEWINSVTSAECLKEFPLA